MEYARCKKGHYYDPSVYQSCPTCSAEAANEVGGAAFGPTEGVSPMENYGATEPAGEFSSGNGFGATEPAGGFSQTNGFGATEPAGGFVQVEDYGKTEPVNMGGSFNGGSNQKPTMSVSSGFTDGGFDSTMGTSFSGGMEDMGVTEPVTQGNVHGFAPVVGWLVAIEGPARGMDYKIRPGYNFIGRDEHMDICIKGDMKISRTKAAVIGYEPEERLFLFGPSEGKSFVKVNGKAVLGQTEIQDHDIIRIGSTKLIFVPLCDERFNWDE